MKKVTRNNVIVWSTISCVIILFAIPIFQREEFATSDNPILPTETPPIIHKPIEITTENSSNAKTTKNLSDRDIVFSARYAVRQYLISPGLTPFPAWPNNSYGITRLEDHNYLVSGKVTAKNIYGVKLQNTWIAKVKFRGSNLEIVKATYIKIGDEVLLDVP